MTSQNHSNQCHDSEKDSLQYPKRNYEIIELFQFQYAVHVNEPTSTAKHNFATLTKIFAIFARFLFYVSSLCEYKFDMISICSSVGFIYHLKSDQNGASQKIAPADSTTIMPHKNGQHIKNLRTMLPRNIHVYIIGIA